jgi:hypothetical protein
MNNFAIVFRLPIFLVLMYSSVLAQEKYTIGGLSTEKVTIVSNPSPDRPEEKGDTSFMHYRGCSVPMKTYFVNGAQYDNIFHPNPTGIYLNGQHFAFYCTEEMSVRQNFSNTLQNIEFSFLGKKYLLLINFREDCLGSGCRYRCYNLYDITNPKSIKHYTFSSVYEGVDSFGDLNQDGVLDFCRAAIKFNKESFTDGLDRYLFTAYTIKDNRSAQIINESAHPYYLIGKGDEDLSYFYIVQSDWFYDVKDTTGSVAQKVEYFAEYISFDPLYKHLYRPDGVKIDKSRFSVFISELNDLEAAQEYCARLQTEYNFPETYIMVDQYTGDIKYQVLVGNFTNKVTALQYQQMMKEKGLKCQVLDFKRN